MSEILITVQPQDAGPSVEVTDLSGALILAAIPDDEAFVIEATGGEPD